MDKTDKIIITLLTIIGVTGIIGIMMTIHAYTEQQSQHQQEMEKLKDAQNTCKMRFGDNISKINGVYNSEGYYCVWTKGREQIEIANTEQHEICHWLIDMDTEGHFCGE